jgi:rhodanese-related sulfurtransferase
MASSLSTLPELPAEISRQELYSRHGDASLTVVDVLPRAAYNQEHITGAINLPLTELPQRAAQVLPDRTGEIAIYCASFT